MQTIRLPQSICSVLNKLNRNFLWGSTYDQRRLHLVKWETVTKPKKQEGLNLREAHTANKVHLTKLGRNPLAGDESVWATVIRGKYLKQGNILQYTPRPTDWATMKGITKSIQSVQDGFGWSLGNGESISLWFDAWVLHEPLCLVVDVIDPDELHLPVKDIRGPNGDWCLHT